MLKTSDILDAFDPQERQKLARELAEVIEQELEELASDDRNPELFDKLVNVMAELQEKRQAKQNMIKDNAMELDYKYLLVETTPQGVRTVTLNRPDRLNAVSVGLAEEIIRAIEEASQDDAVKVLVITGAGRGFCAGLDLTSDNMAEMMKALNGSRRDRLDDLGWVGRQALALVNCDKPVIAAINGPAAGAGLGLALGADIRLIKAGAVVTTGYVRRGLAPDAGVSYFLTRLVGLSRASELILTARDVEAEEAERIGLVSRVLPAENFEAAVADYAAQLAGGPPVALTLAKRLVVGALDTDIQSQLKRELSAIQKCFTTEDVQEALRAYNEKRLPNFKGR